MTLFPIRDALAVDAKQELKNMLDDILKPGVWAIRYVASNHEALLAAKSKTCEPIITGERTSGREDIELLRQLRSSRPHTRLIILADVGTPEEVVTAMREQAFSFFPTPYSLERLAEMIQWQLQPLAGMMALRFGRPLRNGSCWIFDVSCELQIGCCSL